MELNQVIETRRSIRSYEEGKSIEKETVEELLRAAQKAPSWKNSQTARYYVAMSPEMLENVRTCLPEFNRNNSKHAPVLLVTAYEKNRSGFTRDGEAENEVGNGWGCYDLGLQSENILLKATDLGLHTLVMGIRDGEKLKAFLNIPDSQEVVSVIALGYSAASPEMPKRKNLEEIAVFY